MNTSGIYGIFNAISGKVLVGSTANLRTRWNQHRSAARNGRHGNPYFQRAWNLNGEGAFEFRVLEECSKEVLVPREDYWMAFHRSLDSAYGYNMKNASMSVISDEMKRKIGLANSGKRPSVETRSKMSQAHKGKRLPKEQREKMSLAQRGKILSAEHRQILSECHKGNKNPMYGKPLSKEHRHKISLANKGRTAHNKGRPMSEDQKRKLSLAHLDFRKRQREVMALQVKSA